MGEGEALSPPQPQREEEEAPPVGPRLPPHANARAPRAFLPSPPPSLGHRGAPGPICLSVSPATSDTPLSAFPVFSSRHSGPLPPRAETHARGRRAQAYSSPTPTRDYISRRALRLPCGQLTGLVICYESGREGEGGPQRLALPVLVPDPPRWNLELQRCGPRFSSPLGHIPGVS